MNTTNNSRKADTMVIRAAGERRAGRSPGKVGEGGWVNGYNDGMLTAAFLIKKHFGIEL